VRDGRGEGVGVSLKEEFVQRAFADAAGPRDNDGPQVAGCCLGEVN